MKVVLQRVKNAKVEVNSDVVGKINKGLLVFIGFHKEDTKKDLEYIKDKIINLRIFEDENRKMNLSLKDISEEILIVSQFTLVGDVLQGRRPSFTNSMEIQKAKIFYDDFVKLVKNEIKIVQTGIFQAEMQVSLINDGPVTFILENKK